MKRLLILPFLTALLAGISSAEEKPFDIVVYGATGGGVAAAVEAGRLGKSVALVEPQKNIGGMTAGGLGATDIGSKTTVIGLAREFYHRLWKHYQDPATWVHETRDAYKPRHGDAISENLEVQWFFEPKVADKILNGMLSEAGVKVFTGERLLRGDGGVRKEGNKITTLTTESGKAFNGKVFIDASYEGDLMAGAAVSYYVGREANSQYGETLNGTRTLGKADDKPISAYRIAGDPSSGLLPNIEPAPPAENGSTDKRVQAYTFRLCLTDAADNRVPVTKPEGYDPLVYETHLRWVLANPNARPGKLFFKTTPMPNRKTDSNNQGIFSTDFVGRSADWAEASYAERDRMWKEHADYVRGYLWFLGNDPRVPEAIRKETLRWGFPKDEFAETGHWPFQLYVREARRMTSDYVVTEDDCRRNRLAEDGIILASYSMDSHCTSRFVDGNGLVKGEGAFLVRVSPYPVSYRAIVPKEKECSNLIVPVCLSASHAAYGSIRMEPVFMMLGQASAFAAAQAIDGNTSVQAIPADKIRAHLGSASLIAAIKPASATDSGPIEPPKVAATEADRFRDAVSRLRQAGALKGDTQWLDSLKPGQAIDGAKVGELLVSFVSVSKPAASTDAALDTLAADKTLPDTKGYWRENARAGKTCKGAQIVQLCLRLAQALPR